MKDLLDRVEPVVRSLNLPELVRTIPDATLGVSLHQTPPPKPGFVGREEDLDTLRDLPAAASTTATALLTGLGGMGGIGKSELAKVLAQAWRPHYPDAQLWLDGFGTRVTPPPPSAADLITQVLRAFHPGTGQLPDDLPNLEGLLRQTLEGKKALIVLDNAASAAQAAPLHRNLPAGCGFLLTSRHEFLLGTQRPRRVGRLSEVESIALLRGEYAPSLDNSAAAALAKYCAGLPLALRLAGAHLALEGDSPAAVAAYLAKVKASRLGALDSDAPDAGEITIQETLRLSIDPLAPADRAVWLRLGVFTGDWEAAAARAVAGYTADEACLTRLRRRNLLEDLTGEDGAPRHRLHDLAAEYAVKRLAAEEGEATRLAAHLAHARHYAAVGEIADQLYLGGDPLAALALFDRERVQIEAAFAWLSALRGSDEGGQAPRAGADAVLLALVDAVVYTGDLRFHPRQRIAWLEAQAAAAQRLGDRTAEGNALGNLGNAHAALGDARGALGFYEQCLVLHREIGDRRGEGNALGNLGIAHLQLGDARRAIGYHEQALEIAREIGDRRGEGNALGNLGSVHLQLGDARQAIGCYEQRLIIAREIGDRRGEGNALGNLGNAHAALGDARSALGFYEEQLKIVREIGDRRGEGNALGNLGSAAADLGDAECAIGYFEQRLFIAREIGDRRGEGNAHGNLGNAHAAMGDARRAIAFYEQQLEIVREIGDRRGEGNAFGNLGNAHLQLGDARRAIGYYDQALVIDREIGDRRGEGSDLWNSALAQENLGEWAGALARAEAALAIFEAIEDPNAERVRKQVEEWRGF
jgi:tetratricopeptide (TPR) repeat protein